MTWNYESKPTTAREVLVAFRAPDIIGNTHVHYTTSKLSYDLNSWLLPNNYEIIGWADFPRLDTDKDGNRLSHHYLSVQGL